MYLRVETMADATAPPVSRRGPDRERKRFVVFLPLRRLRVSCFARVIRLQPYILRRTLL